METTDVKSRIGFALMSFSGKSTSPSPKFGAIALIKYLRYVLGCRFCLCVSLCCLLPSQSYADALSMTLVSEHLPPLTVIEDRRLVSGSNYTQVMALLKTAEIEHDFKYFPWARTYDYALKNKNVLIFSLARIPEREAHFLWLKLLSSHRTVFLSRKGVWPEVQSLEDAKKYVLGVKRNDVVHHFLLSRGYSEGKNLMVVKDSLMTINMLLSGRIDFANAWPALRKEYCQTLRCSESDFEERFEVEELRQDLWLAASKGTEQHLLERLQKAISEMATAETGSAKTVNHNKRK